MSKTIKTIFLLLAAAIFFAGCSNSSGGGSSGSDNTSASETPDIAVDSITLSDGRWDMDFVTNQTTTISNQQPQQTKTVQHVEANISGDNIEIIKATQKINDGETEDITALMKTRVSRLSDLTNSSDYLSKNSPSGQSFNPSLLTPTVKYYKNKDGTKQRANVTATINLDATQLAALMEQFGESGEMPSGNISVVINSVMDYVKK